MAARRHAAAAAVSLAPPRARPGSPGVWARRLPSRHGMPSRHVEEIQRLRLLSAAAAVIDEVGYKHASVALVTSRARISRRTFYELFTNREELLAALLEDTVAQVERELAAAGLEGLGWRERVRGGLWVILSFLDREPVLARVCVVQALRGGTTVLEARERLLGSIAAVLDEGRTAGARGGECSRLTAEGLVGAGFGIVHGRLLRGERGRLTGLFGELMGMIVLPYMGPGAARREQARPVPGLRAGFAHAPREGVDGREDPLGGVQMRLTYRTARVLECIAECPGASNRVVAERSGVSDPGQISKLLARLERLGLTVNSGAGHAKGEPNAWALTPLGCQVAQRLSVGKESHKQDRRQAPSTTSTTKETR
ncbi:MAG TPA: TetR family transcriptional regulator [Solirubrobacteraceae bacterium]|nr:TetR family transcriptional regulator [Solirubrobacteraceae bacterium]